MRELPPLDPDWPLLTPRGELALRVAIALRGDWTERQIAESLGITVGRVRRLWTRGKDIARRIASGRYRYCDGCGKRLAVDARRDARHCLKPSTCRWRARRAA